MWDLDHKEDWASKNLYFWTVVLETLESPLDSNEIKPVNTNGNQSWIFIGRTDAKAEAPILWPPDVKNWLIGKDPDAGKDWRQEEKGMIKDEMVEWHHQLNGYEFEQAPGVGDGQGSLECYSPWGHKELDTIETLNWTELNCHQQNFNGMKMTKLWLLKKYHFNNEIICYIIYNKKYLFDFHPCFWHRAFKTRWGEP